METSGIHLQTQKCLQNTNWQEYLTTRKEHIELRKTQEDEGIPGENRSVSRPGPALSRWGNWSRGPSPTSGQLSESEDKLKGGMLEFEQCWAYLVAQMVKNMTALQETWVWSLGQEDPLEKGMVTHSIVFFPGKFQQTEETGELHPIGSQRLRHDWMPFASSVLRVFLSDCVSFWCKWRSIMRERETPTQQTEAKGIFNSSDHG